jgi:hypothetical protein
MATAKVFCQSMYASAHFPTEQPLSCTQVRAFARDANGTVVAPARCRRDVQYWPFHALAGAEHADPTGFGGLFRRRRIGGLSGGAYATLHDHKELRPQHLAGSSIGAVNAALIAGNTMPKAVEALKTFWDTVALEPPGFAPWFCYAGHWPSQHAYSWLSVLHARLSGRAGVFYPRLQALMFGNATSVYDLSPLGARLEEFIDFKRLNDGLIRVSVVRPMWKPATLSCSIPPGEITSDRTICSPAAASCQIFRQSKSMAGCLETGVSRQTRQLRQFWMKRQKIGLTSVSCWTSFHLRATGRGRSKTPQRGAGTCSSAIRRVGC